MNSVVTQPPISGPAATAIAAGPLIGGWVTTEYSWRYVFAAETVVMILSLIHI